jgi:hypothetical protein
MINKIKQLLKEKKSYREICKELNISLGKLQRILKTDTDTAIHSDTDTKPIQQSDKLNKREIGEDIFIFD